MNVISLQNSAWSVGNGHLLVQQPLPLLERNKQQALVEQVRDLGTHPGQSPTAGTRIILETLLFLKAQM